MSLSTNEYKRLFQAAYRDPQLVVLEGFHAVKHSLRFGATIRAMIATNIGEIRDLATDLAPDVLTRILGQAGIVDDLTMANCVKPVPRTGIAAIAERPTVGSVALLANGCGGIVVYLEDPRNLGNLGAVVRAAAGAGAAGVITSGIIDPWHPAALRGSAGLHFALTVDHVEELPINSNRATIAIDPDGDDLRVGSLPDDAILAFGTEREGLTDAALERCSARVRIPMEPGVSSLNLATSVAVVLFSQRLASGLPTASGRANASGVGSRPGHDPIEHLN